MFYPGVSVLALLPCPNRCGGSKPFVFKLADSAGPVHTFGPAVEPGVCAVARLHTRLFGLFRRVGTPDGEEEGEEVGEEEGEEEVKEDREEDRDVCVTVVSDTAHSMQVHSTHSMNVSPLLVSLLT